MCVLSYIIPGHLAVYRTNKVGVSVPSGGIISDGRERGWGMSVNRRLMVFERLIDDREVNLPSGG